MIGFVPKQRFPCSIAFGARRVGFRSSLGEFFPMQAPKFKRGPWIEPLRRQRTRWPAGTSLRT